MMLVFINKGWGYRPGDTVTILGGAGETAPWTPGDQNKALGARDMLSYITMEPPQPTDPPGTAMATVGDDLKVEWYPSGSWNTLSGGANIVTNSDSLLVSKINISTSGEYFTCNVSPRTTGVNIQRASASMQFWNSNQLLYRSN